MIWGVCIMSATTCSPEHYSNRKGRVCTTTTCSLVLTKKGEREGGRVMDFRMMGDEGVGCQKER